MIEKIEDRFEEKDLLLDEGFNVRGQLIQIYIRIRYDGNGNSIVRYCVMVNKGEVIFEKHDSAVSNFVYHLSLLR